jgi:hypothetical protein
MARGIGTAILLPTDRQYTAIQIGSGAETNSAILRRGSDGIRVRAVDPFNPLVDREFLE